MKRFPKMKQVRSANMKHDHMALLSVCSIVLFIGSQSCSTRQQTDSMTPEQSKIIESVNVASDHTDAKFSGYPQNATKLFERSSLLSEPLIEPGLDNGSTRTGWTRKLDPQILPELDPAIEDDLSIDDLKNLIDEQHADLLDQDKRPIQERVERLKDKSTLTQQDIANLSTALDEQDISPALVDLLKQSDERQLEDLVLLIKRGGFGTGGFGPMRVIDENTPVGNIEPISTGLTDDERIGIRTLDEILASSVLQEQYSDLLGRNQILPITFLHDGLLAQSAIGAIVGRRHKVEGTAFLVGPNLILTNHHVLPDEMRARTRKLYFDFDSTDVHSGPRRYDNAEEWVLQPQYGFWSDRQLDWALVWCTPKIEQPAVRQPIPLNNDRLYVPSLRVNIVQHPWGDPKRVAIQGNQLESIQPNYQLFYRTDTFKGSSGSPLFDNRWRLIGIHSQSDPDYDGDGIYAYNIGYRIDGIMKSIKIKVDQLEARIQLGI